MRMTRTQLETLLNTLECQVFYNHTTQKNSVNLPFIVYLDEGSNNFCADNKVYAKRQNYLIVVHTKNSTDNIFNSLDTLLDDNSIPYETNGPDWDNSLIMYKTTYVIQL